MVVFSRSDSVASHCKMKTELGKWAGLRIDLPMDAIAAFCRKWEIVEFALFGSVLTDDFRPDSDVDVLVTFAENQSWSLWNLVEMKEELGAILGREVDLVEKSSLRNPFRRHAILVTKRVVYAT